MMLTSIWKASFVLAIASISSTHGQVVTRTMFVNALLLDYDSTVTPTFDKDGPTTVNVSIYVNGINSVNEQNMDFSVNMYLIQSWRDERLSFEGLIESDMVELDSKLISKFWVPDLYFVNEKSSDFHDVTVPNKLLHLYEDGTIVYKTRITVTASCEMDLHHYPFDHQNCSLYIKSFGYSNHSLQLEWDGEEPVDYNVKLRMSQFTMDGLSHRECHDVPDEQNNMTAHGGRPKPLFSCLAVDFVLLRSVGFYTIQIYIPSVLIVVLSWVSFVLDVSAVPARISLGILTVLTMTNMKSIAVSSLPKVSYIKAIDVWMAACLSFVFASLLEFAMVNAFSRMDKAPAPSSDEPDHEPLKCKDGLNVSMRQSPFSIKPTGDKAKNLDRLSLVVFPICFIVFIAIYLLAYLA